MFKTPFKPIGHYVFNYKPRYYDERKERLQALEDDYRYQRKKEEGQTTISKNNLKKEWARAKKTYSKDDNYTYRLLLVITILCIITWGLFNYDKIVNAKQGFSKVIEAIWISLSKAK